MTGHDISDGESIVSSSSGYATTSSSGSDSSAASPHIHMPQSAAPKASTYRTTLQAYGHNSNIAGPVPSRLYLSSLRGETNSTTTPYQHLKTTAAPKAKSPASPLNGPVPSGLYLSSIRGETISTSTPYQRLKTAALPKAKSPASPLNGPVPSGLYLSSIRGETNSTSRPYQRQKTATVSPKAKSPASPLNGPVPSGLYLSSIRGEPTANVPSALQARRSVDKTNPKPWYTESKGAAVRPNGIYLSAFRGEPSTNTASLSSPTSVPLSPSSSSYTSTDSNTQSWRQIPAEPKLAQNQQQQAKEPVQHDATSHTTTARLTAISSRSVSAVANKMYSSKLVTPKAFLGKSSEKESAKVGNKPSPNLVSKKLETPQILPSESVKKSDASSSEHKSASKIHKRIPIQVAVLRPVEIQSNKGTKAEKSNEPRTIASLLNVTKKKYLPGRKDEAIAHTISRPVVFNTVHPATSGSTTSDTESQDAPRSTSSSVTSSSSSRSRLLMSSSKSTSASKSSQPRHSRVDTVNKNVVQHRKQSSNRDDEKNTDVSDAPESDAGSITDGHNQATSAAESEAEEHKSRRHAHKHKKHDQHHRSGRGRHHRRNHRSRSNGRSHRRRGVSSENKKANESKLSSAKPRDLNSSLAHLEKLESFNVVPADELPVVESANESVMSDSGGRISRKIRSERINSKRESSVETMQSIRRNAKRKEKRKDSVVSKRSNSANSKRSKGKRKDSAVSKRNDMDSIRSNSVGSRRSKGKKNKSTKMNSLKDKDKKRNSTKSVSGKNKRHNSIKSERVSNEKHKNKAKSSEVNSYNSDESNFSLSEAEDEKPAARKVTRARMAKTRRIGAGVCNCMSNTILRFVYLVLAVVLFLAIAVPVVFAVAVHTGLISFTVLERLEIAEYMVMLGLVQRPSVMRVVAKRLEEWVLGDSVEYYR